MNVCICAEMLVGIWRHSTSCAIDLSLRLVFIFCRDGRNEQVTCKIQGASARSELQI